jgi:ATP-binding cassette subfamily B protein
VKIKSALGNLSKNSTFVNISHRISSIKDADHIIFLDEGQIREQGSHEELMAKNGLYADLYARQLLQMEEEEI